MKHAEKSNEKQPDSIQELCRKQAAAERMEKRLKAKGHSSEMFKEQKEQLRKKIEKMRRG